METKHISTANHSVINGINHVSVGRPVDKPDTEIDDIISEKPSFIVRWGISLLFLILIALGTVSWFIQYPDIVKANGVLNSINASKELIAHTNGKLVKLFAKEGQRVAKNDIIGYMESIGDPGEIISLSGYLENLSRLLYGSQIFQINDTAFNTPDNLGELQAAYQIFIQARIDYTNYLGSGFYLRKRAMLNKDLEYLKKLHATLIQQKSLMEEDLALADTTFKSQEILKQEKVISSMNYREEKSKLLAKAMGMPQISSSLISNENSQHEKLKEIAELENRIQQQKGLFIQAVNTMISEAEAWKKKYLLVAPIDGTFNLSGFIQENQQLQQDQIIGFVNPGNSNYYVETSIPQYNFGKVRINQEVLLNVLAYPYEEFGKLKARIAFISDIPSDSGYLAKIILSDGLVTNHGRHIKYRPGLNIQLDIITTKRRLLERFWSSLSSKFYEP